MKAKAVVPAFIIHQCAAFKAAPISIIIQMEIRMAMQNIKRGIALYNGTRLSNKPMGIGKSKRSKINMSPIGHLFT